MKRPIAAARQGGYWQIVALNASEGGFWQIFKSKGIVNSAQKFPDFFFRSFDDR
jgi:hypothetical protein